MADDPTGRNTGSRGNDAATLGVWITLQYDVMSATNSSPQTTEINAGRRAGTLMKWVYTGLAQGMLLMFIGIAAETPGKKWRPVLGSLLGAGLMWIQYEYALRSGLKSLDLPTTEEYDNDKPTAEPVGGLRYAK